MSTPTTPMSTTCTAATKTFTLNDLAKIALGAPELTREHLSVLQSLLIILLQKLNCHNETVRIHGFPATSLQKLLNATPANTQYDFKLQSLEGFKEKYELLEKLEQSTKNVEAKLEEHFAGIRNCYKTYIFKAEVWAQYAAPDEDLCTYFMPHNKELCLLFRDTVFNKELRRRSTYPLIEKIRAFENRIAQMQRKIRRLTEQIKAAEPKLNCIKFIIQDIETIRPGINKSNETFREAMTEAQEMLNCKVERVALPALRKFLDERFVVVKKYLKNLIEGSDKCELWKPLTIEKSTCISCSIYDDLKHLRNFKPIQTINENEECLCNNVVKEATILEKVDRLTPYVMLNLGINRSLSVLKRNTRTKNAGILKVDDNPICVKEEQKVESTTRKSARASKRSASTASIKSLKERKLKSVGLTRHVFKQARKENKLSS